MGKDPTMKELEDDASPLGNEGIIKLKDNKIPKGMVSLERIFYLNIPAEKHQSQNPNVQEIITINLGTPNQGKNMHISSNCTKDEQEILKSLLS